MESTGLGPEKGPKQWSLEKGTVLKDVKIHGSGREKQLSCRELKFGGNLMYFV